MTDDERRLFDKLRRIEALFAGAATAGERDAAAEAAERIRARLREVEKTDRPVEYRFTVADPWSARLLLALLRRYGIAPYRYRGQRRTTVMARLSRSFAEETLWPEFEELSATLRGYLEEVTRRVIEEAMGASAGEAEEREAPDRRALPPRNG